MRDPNTQAAELHTEIRRLRVRVSGLSAQALNATQAAGTRSRRELIRVALAELSRLGAAGAAVPALSDYVLADQLVVLLRDCLPEYGSGADTTRSALDIAVRLRRELA